MMAVLGYLGDPNSKMNRDLQLGDQHGMKTANQGKIADVWLWQLCGTYRKRLCSEGTLRYGVAVLK